MNRKNNIIKMSFKLLLCLLMVGTIFSVFQIEVKAAETGASTSTEAPASPEELGKAIKEMENHMKILKLSNTLSDKTIEKMDELFTEAKAHIQQGESVETDLTVIELNEYVANIKAALDRVAAEKPPVDVPEDPNTKPASSGTKEKYCKEIEMYVANVKLASNPNSDTVWVISNIAANGKNYIEDNSLTESEIISHVSGIKAKIDQALTEEKTGDNSSGKEFIVTTDNVETPVATYGQSVSVILSVLNLGDVDLENVIVTPVTDVSISKWPFELTTAGYTETIKSLRGNETYEDALAARQELNFTFQTREDVLNGYYRLEFDLTYTRNGAIETSRISTYVETVGAPGSGNVDQVGEEGENASVPRIIVTGFTTTPGEVYAGDTFTVAISIKNTSKRTAVSNMQIDLKATPEGETDNKYEAFLPTSGSNTVYIDNIAPSGTTEIAIEMTAKADLAQKPYVLEVKMDYEDETFTPYTSTASVSIPIKQEAKVDSSSPEVMPMDISVGDQSNIMFSIYNIGKTTLYNVQVKFQADSITGGDVFVGKIEAGETGNVDSMVTGAMATMDDGKIIAAITYEDDAGNQTVLEKEMNLFVMEAMIGPDMDMDMNMGGDMGMIEGGDMMLENGAGSKTPLIIGGVVGVVVIAIIIAVVVLKKRKKKKALLDDLMDDL